MGSVLGSLGGGGGLGALFGQAQQGGGGGGGGFSDIIRQAFGGMQNRTPLVNPRPGTGAMGGSWGGHMRGVGDRMTDQNQWRAPQMGGQLPANPKLEGMTNLSFGGRPPPTIPDSPISQVYGGKRRRPGGGSPWAV